MFFGPGTWPKRKRRYHRWNAPSSSSTRTASRAPSTTSRPISRSRHRHRSIPGTGQPIGPDDLAPLFPMELIKQVVSTDREIEIPDPVREAYALYRPSPLYPRAPARAGARYAGAHLLQVRGRQPGRQPQAQHRHRPGVLRQAGGRDPLRDRDRRRPVGQRARVRRLASSGSRSRSTWSAPATTRSRTDAS